MSTALFPITRRRFGLSLCGAAASPWLRAALPDSMPWNEPAALAKLYLSTPHVHWPKPTLDVPAEIREIEARLAEVERANAASVRFTGGDVLRTAEDAKAWLAKADDIDGALLIPLAQPTPALGALMDGMKVPSLFFSRPYATHAWSSIAEWQRKGKKKVDVVATSSYGDLDPYMRSFRTVRHLRKSKVLVGAQTPAGRQELTDSFTREFGTGFRFVTGPEFKSRFDAVDEREAQKAADEFVSGALRVVEPSPKEIRDGLRFYLALARMLKDEKANALTIDCFGSLAADTLPGYPCIAWSKFNDAGLYGVCEADINSTMTQMLVTSYSGMPGFVSDPVFDISRNEVIHAHCVAATRMKGINGPASPYIIRNHLETNEGAVLQVLMPSGETVTVARFVGPGKCLLSTAEVTGPVDSDRGCRCQIRTRVSNAEKWLRSFSHGLHRVVFYGDHVRDIERMGRLMGFEAAHEM
ncbi:MAG: hypothetical protein KIT09_01160 [Bryobacteraceae bacterium]|nr:hypothetical protein [Bryobacteraceae bacterium]